MKLVVDSSALIAIARGEPEAESFRVATSSLHCVIGWPTALECRIACIRQAPKAIPFLDRFLTVHRNETVVFDRALYDVASLAFDRFGKGRHAAKLNFGDCMTYAVAVSRNLPLLFKGGDFGLTDVRVHPASVLSASANI